MLDIFPEQCYCIAKQYRAAEAWRIRQATVLQLFTRCPPCSPIFMQKRMQISTAVVGDRNQTAKHAFLIRSSHSRFEFRVSTHQRAVVFSLCIRDVSKLLSTSTTPPLLCGISRRILRERFRSCALQSKSSRCEKGMTAAVLRSLPPHIFPDAVAAPSRYGWRSGAH